MKVIPGESQVPPNRIVYNTRPTEFLYKGTRTGPGQGVDRDAYPQLAQALQIWNRTRLVYPVVHRQDEDCHAETLRIFAELSKALHYAKNNRMYNGFLEPGQQVPVGCYIVPTELK